MTLPLFDRLCPYPQEAQDSPKALLASLARDLRILLEARPAVSWEELDQRPPLYRRLPQCFGVPAFPKQDLLSERDRRKIEKRLAETITFFEPRLSHVKVSLEPNPLDATAAIAHIQAYVPQADEVTRWRLTLPAILR
jgi:type VI secretion system lysozyme-like protein